ncbi:hypothetical protein RUM44_012666 [Polyplax serrata]|uniref:Uncharacterized protein n=1 Tax=Polyplax serrata TaxID=468196 RepID=A0ABR1BFU4_POLSC
MQSNCRFLKLFQLYSNLSDRKLPKAQRRNSPTVDNVIPPVWEEIQKERKISRLETVAEGKGQGGKERLSQNLEMNRRLIKTTGERQISSERDKQQRVVTLMCQRYEDKQ